MKATRLKLVSAGLRHTALAASLLAVSSGAWAAVVGQFTVTPSGVGLTGGSFNATSLKLSDYSRTIINANNTFSEFGYLPVTGAELAGVQVATPGLGSTYGLYMQFTGSGVVLPSGQGAFNTLSYTLYGYSGSSATFSIVGTTPTVTGVSNPIVLASGAGTGGFGLVFGSASASTQLNFASNSPAFFTDPLSFYRIAQASFTATSQQTTIVNGNTFIIREGGGVFNFIPSSVPEPETYALMLAGLAMVGFVASRRKD